MLAGKRVLIKPFETKEEVIQYVNLYNNLDERAKEDHLELSNLDNQLKLFAKNKFISDKKSNYMIQNKNKVLIGMIQWKKESDFEMTLGYRLFESCYRNKGYMTDALTTFIAHIFTEHLDITRISLYIHNENVSSIKLAEKLGFIYEGTMREAYKYRDKIVGFCIYSLLKKEYVES
jgi:RimJ/RimL family protein N-acetyltransferase